MALHSMIQFGRKRHSFESVNGRENESKHTWNRVMSVKWCEPILWCMIGPFCHYKVNLSNGYADKTLFLNSKLK